MEECIICREEGGIFVDYGCPSKHMAHGACIEAWLENSNICPSCMQTVKIGLESVEQLLKYFESTKIFDQKIIESLNTFSIEMQLECIKKVPNSIYIINNKTPELCRLAVEKDGRVLDYIPDGLITPELCRLALETSNGEALEFIPKKLITPEFCRLAVANYGNALEYVPKKLKTPEL